MQQDNPTPATAELSVDTPYPESGWRRGWRKVWRGIMTLGHTAIAIGLIAGLVVVLQQRADAVSPIASLPAVTVDTAIARQESGYNSTRRFTGRIEAVRQTSVSAELGGKVNKILVREGQQVNSGDVIARLDTRSLRAQRAEQAARRRTLEKDRELAELNANRQKTLKDKGFSSGQAWDAARLQLETVESSLLQLDASIRTINVSVGKAVVRAPFSGTVGARLVDEGTMLAPGTPILSLFDSGSSQVRVGLPPAIATTLHADQPYTLETSAGQVNAKLVQIRPDLNEVTRTVTAIFSVASEDLPRYGQLAELVLPTRQDTVGFWLPLSALKAGQRGLWDVLIVMEKDDQPVVAREAVEVIHADGDNVFVRGTLTDGARYIRDGVHRVTIGQQVRLSDERS